jgi:hypothetical protein
MLAAISRTGGQVASALSGEGDLMVAKRTQRRFRRLVVAFGLVGVSAATGVIAPEAGAASATKIVELSKSCPASSAEVEQAVDPKTGDIFSDWIGCDRRGIGFVLSTDGGSKYSRPMILPASAGKFTWDPAVTVALDGTVYASFMIQDGNYEYPIVDVSIDHGRSFVREARLRPAKQGNWGDRDFIAAGRDGTVYVTWDYGPSAAAVKFICPPGGSCSFTNGDLNIVVQKSTNWGRTWGAIVHVSPGYPAGGADEGPIIVEPDGHIDLVYQALSVTNRKTYKLGPGHEYFTSSTDDGAHWQAPVVLGQSAGTESMQEWWIDGALGMDAAGNLYATWDTQGAHDVGWLVYSTDNGRRWSKPVRVTPDVDSAVHIVQVAGASAGIADVGWLADSSPHGYALYLRPYSITKGWLGGVVRASGSLYGRSGTWPGDTFGISYLGQNASASSQHVSVSWGSSASSSPDRDDIYARPLSLTA